MFSVIRPIFFSDQEMTENCGSKIHQKAIAESTERHLARDEELVQFFKDEGLKVYEPDVKAFQDHAQKMYLESPLSKSWPEGMLDEINKL